MNIFIYNYFTRHIYNFVIYWGWYLEKGTFVGSPRCGKITKDALNWTRKF